MVDAEGSTIENTVDRMMQGYVQLVRNFLLS